MKKLLLCAVGFASLLVIAGCETSKSGSAKSQNQITKDERNNVKGDFVAKIRGGFWGFADSTGRWVVKPRFINLSKEATSPIPYLKNGLFGYIDQNGRILVQAQFSVAWPFENGVAWVKKNGLWGLIDQTGKFVIPITYESSLSFGKDTYAGVQLDGKWGFVDRSGNIKIEPQFDMVASFDKDVARVCKDNKWGYINRSGEIIIPCQYDSVDLFSQDMAAVNINGKSGYINIKGEYVIQPKYDFAWSFEKCGIARVKTLRSIENGVAETHFSFIDKEGNEAFSGKYEDVFVHREQQVYANGLCCVKENGSWHFIDEKGNNAVNEMTFEFPFAFDLDCACIKVAEGWGLLGTNGSWIIQPKNNILEIWNFRDYSEDRLSSKSRFHYTSDILSEGLIGFKYELSPEERSVTGMSIVKPAVRKWAYLKKVDGTQVYPELPLGPLYDEAANFSDGQAWVNVNKTWYKLQKDGDLIDNGKHFYFNEKSRLVPR